MADVTPPSVVVIEPLDGAVDVLINSPVEFDIVDAPEGGTGPATLITLADYFAIDDLSVQLDDVATVFTTVGPYKPGTLEVLLGGTDQTSRFTETSPSAGTFTMVGPPLIIEGPLVAKYMVPWNVNSVDLTTVVIKFNGVTVFQNSAWESGFNGTIEPIDYGYHFIVTLHPDFAFETFITVAVDGADLAEPPNVMSTFTWTFLVTSQVHHSLPYIKDPSPADMAVSVSLMSDIVFKVKTDDTTTPALAIKPNELVSLNGVVIIQNGVNILPGLYTVSFLYELRQVTILIHPILPLAPDTVYSLEGTFEDDTGSVGTDGFVFSTGGVGFAIQIDRSEPLLCPIDNIPVPLFTTGADVQVVKYRDTVTSITTDWKNRGLLAYDAIEIPDGPDAGRWLVRDAENVASRLYHIFDETSATKQASAFLRREFADRNPVSLVFSPMFNYKFQKIWGDTQLRYLAGNPSDAHFPVAFHDVPIGTIHDSNFSIAGAVADATDGALSFNGTGVYNVDLAPGSRIRFGDDHEVYTVNTVAASSFSIVAGTPFNYQRRLSGTIAVTNGSTVVTGTNTLFTSEAAFNLGVRFSTDPSTIYRIDMPLSSDTTINLQTPYTGPTTINATMDVVTLQNVKVHKLDNTVGGTFDDQTNRRLDFNLVCNPATTSSAWDRYSLIANTKFKPILTNTASLTNGSGIVAVSGTQYRNELYVGAMVTFGTSTVEYEITNINNVAPQFTISPVWAGVNLSGQPINRNVTGTRSIAVFRVTEMAERTEFFVGLNTTGGSPTTDNNDRVGCNFVRRQDGSIGMNGWLGTTEIQHTTDLHVSDFVGKDWVLEFEFLTKQTVLINLFSYDDLNTVNANRTVTVENAGLPAANPVFDRWTITTLSSGASQLNSKVAGYVSYVDLDPGLGASFDLGLALVDSSNAKARLARNIHEIPLAGTNGYKTLSVQAGIVSDDLTASQYDRIFWDVDEVIVVITNLSVQGGVVSHLDHPSRAVKKFSFKQGFDQIDISFRASRRGLWYVMIDSDQPSTGLIAARGTYDVANAVKNVTIDGSLFGGLPDGLHTLHVVLCKDPVPSSVVVLPAVASLSATANILKNTGSAIYGIAEISAEADVIPAAEEDLMVIEDLSAQVAGGGGVITLFTTGVPYRTGKIKLILDGVIQNFNPIPLRVVETDNTTGQVSLSSAPNVNQKLVAEYVPL